MFLILTVIPSFVEVKKLRLKKLSEDFLTKQTVIINKNLSYNLKTKKFLN